MTGTHLILEARLSARSQALKVAALIPCYGEERTIGEIVRRTARQVEHVLVVDDGSRDATAKRARKAGAEVIIHERNQGKGAAIKTGLRKLSGKGYDYILILDGDGQHVPEEIPRFLDLAVRDEAAQLIVGSRMSEAGAMPLVRRLTNKIMSAGISVVCGQEIPDSQCGFRMIHRDLVPAMFCESTGYAYETEMLFAAVRRGSRIASVPVSAVYGEEVSKIQPVRDTVRFLGLMARALTQHDAHRA